eukprot:1228528-Amphidinium_carterae.1
MLHFNDLFPRLALTEVCVTLGGVMAISVQCPHSKPFDKVIPYTASLTEAGGQTAVASLECIRSRDLEMELRATIVPHCARKLDCLCHRVECLR